MLVDEPANHLDPFHQVSSYERLGRLWQQSGRTVIVVTHDVRLAQVLGPADKVRVIGIRSGGLVSETHLGAPELPRLLGDLYGVDFVPPGEPGGLAVRLNPGSSGGTRPKSPGGEEGSS
jgi:ABC-type cobalamin/Fe3+-siderophores transport system ATPase subunit